MRRDGRSCTVVWGADRGGLDDASTSAGLHSETSSSVADDSYGVVNDALDAEIEYEGLPHFMGAPDVRTFSRRPAREHVHLSDTLELSLERHDGSGRWDIVTSEVIDRLKTGSGKYSEKKTYRKQFTESTFFNDNPVKNDRKSTTSMFFI